MSAAGIAWLQKDLQGIEISLELFLRLSPDIGTVDAMAMSWRPMHLRGRNNKRLGLGSALQVGLIHC